MKPTLREGARVQMGAVRRASFIIVEVERAFVWKHRAGGVGADGASTFALDRNRHWINTTSKSGNHSS